jgi:HlyD family secretion protein
MDDRFTDPAPPYLERSPAPWAVRALAGILIVLFVVALLAAIVIRVPETISSRFVLVPVRGVDQVRAARDGSLIEIRAAEAQTIARGDVMFLIRSAAIGDRSAEMRSLEAHVQGATDRLANERQRYESGRLADEQETRRLRDRLGRLVRELDEQQALRAARDTRYQATLAIYRNELEITRREIDFKRRQFAIARELADRTEIYYQKGVISWLENNNRQLEAGRLEAELQQLEKQVDSGQLKISQLISDYERQQIEWKIAADQLATDRREAETAIDKLRHESAARRTTLLELERSLSEDTRRSTIRTSALKAELSDSRGNELSVPAPCAGTVLRLWVQRPGAVVKEGEPLAELACGGGQLQAELTVPPTGVGQVQPAQPVKLLYDTFPYQRHGVRRGTVRWVSPASVTVDGGGRVFRVFADIEDATITVKGEPRPLTAGMGGRAEVVVGRRALITYAFEPIRQLRESLADAPATRKDGGQPR